MRVFLTGGTGFVGSHFIARAMAAGHEIVAVRRTTESKPRVPLSQEPVWLTKGLEEITAADLEGCEAFVHLAAAGVSPQVATWGEMIHGNVAVPQQLFQLAAECGIKRWVVAGTFAEYGLAGERYEFIPENAPLEPTYPYAASKAAFFSIIHAMAMQSRAQLAYFRIFSAFGEGQYHENFWPSLKAAALAGRDFPMTPGAQIRDFVPVEDVARAFVLAVDRADITPGEPWVKNLASGQPTTIADFGRGWWDRFDAQGKFLVGELPYRPNEVMRYVPEVDHSIFSAPPTA